MTFHRPQPTEAQLREEWGEPNDNGVTYGDEFVLKLIQEPFRLAYRTPDPEWETMEDGDDSWDAIECIVDDYGHNDTRRHRLCGFMAVSASGGYARDLNEAIARKWLTERWDALVQSALDDEDGVPDAPHWIRHTDAWDDACEAIRGDVSEPSLWEQHNTEFAA